MKKIGEIEGLRAIAVIAVILYHAKFGFSGGYVGVDVFFVISGFLITSLLLNERRDRGRVRLLHFYARRARRLLPAATVTIVVTLLLSWWVFDALRAREIAKDGLFSGLFVSNIRFVTNDSDYFATDLIASPFQHFWSLSVEEQFYLIWPVLLLSVWLGARNIQRRFLITGGVITVASFVWSVLLIDSSPSWTFFMLPTRAWELVAGGLLAVAVPYVRGRVNTLRATGGWVGLVIVVGTMLLYNDTTTFPGVDAVPVVAGAALLIIAIESSSVLQNVLSCRPMQWVGARSYSLYLWHWPFLILWERAHPDPSWGERLGVVAASVVVAALTYALIEDPIRRRDFFVRHDVRSLGFGAGLVGFSTVIALVMSASLSLPTTDFVAPSASVTTTTAVTATTIPRDPFDEYNERVNEALRPLIDASGKSTLLPANVRPSLDAARDDRAEVFRNGCTAGHGDVENPLCEFGDLTSDVSIVLFGDSHMAHWFPAFEEAGRQNGWKITVLTKLGCPPATVSVRLDDKRVHEKCNTWRQNSIERIVASDADIVVMASYSYRAPGKNSSSIPLSTMAAGLETTAGAFTNAGKKVVMFTDTPVPRVDVVDCIAGNSKSLNRCHYPRNNVTNSGRSQIEQKTIEALGGRYFNVVDLFCTDVCPSVIGDAIVYFDDDHVTQTYAKTLSPYVSLLMKSVLY
jgi:peptidoglycan/LPS O-acetylase OafA/YrhL